MAILRNAVRYAIREKQNFALTTPIWEGAEAFLCSFPQLCFKKNPAALQAARLIWRLNAKKKSIQEIGRGGFYADNELATSLAFIGIFSATFCDCHYCSSVELATYGPLP